MTPEQEREAFEAWARHEFYGDLACPSDTWSAKRRGYSDFAHHMAFHAWKAAIAQPASVPADAFAVNFVRIAGLDKRKARECEDIVRQVLAAAPQAPQPAQAVPQLTGCNCRWDGETQVQWCELHLAHKEAIHDWAERAKTAEAKLAAPQPEAQPQKLLGYLSEHTGPDGPYKWQFSKDLFGVYHDTALRVIPVYEPAAPSAQAEPIAALVAESERLGLYDVPPLAELREKLGGWDVPEVSGKQAEQGGK